MYFIVFAFSGEKHVVWIKISILGIVHHFQQLSSTISGNLASKQCHISQCQEKQPSLMGFALDVSPFWNWRVAAMDYEAL